MFQVLEGVWESKPKHLGQIRITGSSGTYSSGEGTISIDKIDGMTVSGTFERSRLDICGAFEFTISGDNCDKFDGFWKTDDDRGTWKGAKMNMVINFKFF